MYTARCGLQVAVVLFWLKYRLGHPENYLLSLSSKLFSGSKYPKNSIFNFENRSIASDACSARKVPAR